MSSMGPTFSGTLAQDAFSRPLRKATTSGVAGTENIKKCHKGPGFLGEKKNVG